MYGKSIMDAEDGLRFVEELIRSHGGKPLRDLQRAVFLGSWQGKDYKEIHRDCNHVQIEHLMRNVAPKLWKLLSTVLSEVLGEEVKVQKDYLKAPVERSRDRLLLSHGSSNGLSNGNTIGLPEPAFCEVEFGLDAAEQETFDNLWKDNLNQICDWGDAPDVALFQGGKRNLATVQQWIEEDGCRLVAICGMAGIGKTAFSTRLAQNLRDRCEILIWRSLDNFTEEGLPPTLPDLLATLVQTISGQSNPRSNLARFLEYLRAHRCLIVLDGWETLLQGGLYSGTYRKGYEGYGELLRRVGDVAHQSCLMITSREKPSEIEAREGDAAPVRSLSLGSLSEVEVQELFTSKGQFNGSEQDWRTLAHRYGGNPAFLQQAATTIASAFGRDITRFLNFQKDAPIFVGQIRTLLAEQMDRLSPLERTIVGEFAQRQEPATLEDLLRADPPIPHDLLLEGLLSLVRRSLVSTDVATYTVNPLVLDYGRLHWHA